MHAYLYTPIHIHNKYVHTRLYTYTHIYIHTMLAGHSTVPSLEQHRIIIAMLQLLLLLHSYYMYTKP